MTRRGASAVSGDKRARDDELGEGEGGEEEEDEEAEGGDGGGGFTDSGIPRRRARLDG